MHYRLTIKKQNIMKNYTIIIFSILLFFSCNNKEVENEEFQVNGTIWVTENGFEQLEFFEDYCTYTNNSDAPDNTLSFNYIYEYKENNITLLVPAITGFYNYTGEIIKDKMTLSPIFRDDEGNTFVRDEEGFTKIFYKNY